jgi:putative membrane protein
MNRFLIRWAINAIALYVAVSVVPGISLQSSNWLALVWLALIFGVINAFLGPLLKLLTCPLILLTLGLFTLIINTLLLYLAGYVGSAFGVGFTIDSFWYALLASLVISVVSIVLSLFFRDELKNK